MAVVTAGISGNIFMIIATVKYLEEVKHKGFGYKSPFDDSWRETVRRLYETG